MIRDALAIETVGWIRSALLSISNGGGGRQTSGQRRASTNTRMPAVRPDTATIDELTAQIRDEVTHELSLSLVHILEPIVGSLRVYAAKEVPEFESSNTSIALRQLVDLLNSIHRLGRASAPPKLAETRIGALMATIVASDFASDRDRVELRGSSETRWVTDPILVSVIVSAALRNGIEAQSDLNLVPVSCDWEIEGGSLLVRIADRGQGPTQHSSALFEPGVTTKPGHVGLGLAVARQAARSLGASISLRADGESGGLFVLTLPQLAGGSNANPRD